MRPTVIVGGGTSGLAAAYTLERAGAPHAVLEKRDVSGGRIAGKIVNGFTLDLGAQFMFSRYRTLADLLETLGVRDQLLYFRPFLAIARHGTTSPFSMDLREYGLHPLETIKSLNRLLSFRGQLRLVQFGLKCASLGRQLDFDDPLKAVELDSLSFAEYALRHFGKEILDHVVQPLASTLTLGTPEEISAAYGLALAWWMAPGLGTFRTGGIGFLAETLSAQVRGNVRLNTSVTRIVVENKKVRGVEIANGGTPEFIEADNVICGTPAGEAARLLGDLPNPITEILAGIRYSACVHVMLGVPGRPLGKLYGVSTLRQDGLCFSVLTESALKAPGYTPAGAGLIHAFTYAEFASQMLEMSETAILRRVMTDIRRLLPNFPDPLFCEIVRWPQAVCLSSPGQIAQVQALGNALRAYEGLHLAGEYFGMPSVEAAHTSGVRAAERVLTGC